MKISFNYYPEGKQKALTMSYDDGQIYDRRLVEIFNKYGIKGTFHLNSGFFDKEPFLSASEIGALFKGHEISAHSLTHPYLTLVPREVVIEEILEDRKRLEALAGYPVRGMSYPYGAFDDALVNTLPCLGIEYSRTVHSHGGFYLPDNFLRWNATCKHEENLLEKHKAFSKLFSRAQMPLFYVWGHSFEIELNKEWKLIEEFCKRASYDEAVWYATNIEIMDYVKALRNLKFDVELKMVYNPSCIPVWIGVEGQPVKIQPGQTQTI